MKKLLTVYLISYNVGFILSIEPVSGLAAFGAAAVAGIWSLYKPIGCLFHECCQERWIWLNDTALESNLKAKLYGQHLVTSTVISHVKAHMMSKKPSKAMALSFHGGTGTGKNYVSKIIAESIYHRGMNSKYVHLIAATKEFPHEDMVPLYKDKLRDLIEKSIRECPRSLFIFDEIDKMPAGIIDTIKPYLDFYEHLNGVDYRKSMFIFLSNTGSKEIMQITMDHWKSSSRENIKLFDLERIVTKAALNTKTSGLYHSDVLIRHMVTAYVPFLPLERKHVRECIKDFLVNKGYRTSRLDIPDSIVRDVAEQLHYYPDDLRLFSITGCKRVPEKVDFIALQHEL